MEQDDRLQQLKTELEIARLSQPSDDALQKYYQLSKQIEPSTGASIWQTIKATLSWDSRDRLAAHGARGVAQDQSYRLLYEAEQTEIEIMIESQAQYRFIEGDIVLAAQVDEASIAHSMALVTLIPTGAAQTSTAVEPLLHYEVESDAHGRFRLENIAAGAYTMQLLMLDGQFIELPTIEL